MLSQSVLQTFQLLFTVSQGILHLLNKLFLQFICGLPSIFTGLAHFINVTCLQYVNMYHFSLVINAENNLYKKYAFSQWLSALIIISHWLSAVITILI